MQAQKGRKRIALVILNLSARWGHATPRPLEPLGKSPGTQCPGAGLDGCGPEKISFPHRRSTFLVLHGKNVDIGSVYRKLLGNCRGRDNWYRKPHTLFTGVNKFLFLLCTVTKRPRNSDKRLQCNYSLVLFTGVTENLSTLSTFSIRVR